MPDEAEFARGFYLHDFHAMMAEPGLFNGESWY